MRTPTLYTCGYHLSFWRLVFHCCRAENGALEPLSLNQHFGAPRCFSPEAPTPLFWRVSERIWARIGGAPNADPTTTDPTPHSQPSDFIPLRFPIEGLFWYRISTCSHQNPCLQAPFKLFSTKCLAIDLSSHVAWALWDPLERLFPLFLLFSDMTATTVTKITPQLKTRKFMIQNPRTRRSFWRVSEGFLRGSLKGSLKGFWRGLEGMQDSWRARMLRSNRGQKKKRKCNQLDMGMPPSRDVFIGNTNPRDQVSTSNQQNNNDNVANMRVAN